MESGTSNRDSIDKPAIDLSRIDNWLHYRLRVCKVDHNEVLREFLRSRYEQSYNAEYKRDLLNSLMAEKERGLQEYQNQKRLG